MNQSIFNLKPCTRYGVINAVVMQQTVITCRFPDKDSASYRLKIYTYTQANIKKIGICPGMSQTPHQARWYVKKNGRIQGPFPNQLISQYLILGRLSPDCEVSQDQLNWAPVKNFRALVPDVVLHADTAEGARALMLARVREDERSARGDDANIERRAEEDPSIKLHRQLRNDINSDYHSRFQLNLRYLLPILTLVAVMVLAFIFYRPVIKITAADCTAHAAPGVDWSACNKQGVILPVQDLAGSKWVSTLLNGANLKGSRLDKSDLSYANLSQASLQQTSLRQAQLKGAVMLQADLQGADLTRADLSYAELTGALLQGAVLEGARFDHAIWVNGEVCVAGSVGGCLLAK